jgi:hypothetical protein
MQCLIFLSKNYLVFGAFEKLKENDTGGYHDACLTHWMDDCNHDISHMEAMSIQLREVPHKNNPS